MSDKELLKIKRYIELEEYLAKKYDKSMEIRQFIEMIMVDLIEKDDFDYISLALRIPFNEIKEYLDYYDNFFILNKPNEIQFIYELKKRFNVSEKELFKRIRQVRKIDFVKNSRNKRNRKRKRMFIETKKN